MHKFIFGLITATCLTFEGCGGDGGNSSVVTPPPGGGTGGGGTSNTPPTVTLSADKSSLDEGQPFTLDASGSSDSDGDILTYTWVQTAGTNIDLSNVSGNMITLNAAEVSQTETATFEVQVSDGTDTRTASVDIEFLNIVQTPQEDFPFEKYADHTTQNPIYYFRGVIGDLVSEQNSDGELALIGTSPNDEEPIDYSTLFQADGSNAVIELNTKPFPRNFPRPHFIRFDPRPDSITAGQVMVSVRDEGQIIEYLDFPQNSEEIATLEIEKPCHLIRRGGFTGRPEDVPVYLIVPQHINQVTYFEDDGLDGIISLENISRRFFRSESIDLCQIVGAIDTTILRTDYRNRVTFTNVDFLSFTGNESLVVKDIIADYNQGNLVLLSDNNHNGDHRIIHVARNFSFTELDRWELGVPNAIHEEILNPARPTHSTITVTVPSTPNLRVYKNVSIPISADIPYELPESIFQEVGLGAYELNSFPITGESKVLIYRNQNRIDFFNPRP